MTLLSSCVANPGPPPVEEPMPTPEPSATSSAAPTPSRAEAVIDIGVDPLHSGLNPHLISDNSSFVESLAGLVLPSAFRDGVMDTDVLTSAEEVPADRDGVAQSLRYVIAPGAQWSDGTPITGADFRYMWHGMSDTPAVVDPAGYHAITGMRVSADGRTVDVDLATAVAEWRDLFSSFLPSHLLQSDASDFERALADTIPASAGRYMIRSVDRSRGIITINRNDRFWGENPASIDLVNFREVRSVTQGAEQLRSGQIGFLDTFPAETSVDAYSIMTGTQVRTVKLERELQLSLSTTSTVLADVAAREELRSLIDVPLIARIAAGRSSNLRVPDHQPAADATFTPALLQSLTAEQPLRLGVNVGDDASAAAGRAIVELLAARGVKAQIISTDLPEITGILLPRGRVDAVITWENTDNSATGLAGEWLCPEAPSSPRAANLSAYCTPESDAVARDVLSGIVAPEDASEVFERINEREHVTIPLLGDTRVQVLGEGIVGPDPNLNNWTSTAALSTVPSWRKL
ncbi:extracellular solute-binding protein, family 5 [Corynebacterium testudinoris]|uniref:Extracellular solute-binding protein, family 5 n=1 Tax=Corynebacterium testudinoris TaxID=136857 RepID=A0A0G3HB63_9CORY|nr:extracellular solute-binding protein, family 5 [Corynebacterium testudinoris]